MDKIDQLLMDAVDKATYSYTPDGTMHQGWIISRLQAEALWPKVDYTRIAYPDAAAANPLSVVGVLYKQKLLPKLDQLEKYANWLSWFKFKCISNISNAVVLQNEWYRLAVQAGGRFKLYKVNQASKPTYFQTADEAIDWLMRQVDYGTHYTYVAGVAITPKQRFSSFKDDEDYTELADILCQANAQLAFHNAKVFRWVSKYGEIEIKQSSYTTTMAFDEAKKSTEEEEDNMNIFDLIASESLYEVKVTFEGSSSREYSYKSEVAYEPGATVVVETPSTGLTVVTVVSSTKGLSGGDFPKYKWIVGALDTKRYKELLANEQNAIAKLAAVKRAQAAKKELEALGLSEADVLSMLGLASKAE